MRQSPSKALNFVTVGRTGESVGNPHNETVRKLLTEKEDK